MKLPFAILLAALIAATFAIVKTLPPPPGGGRTVLVWVTDDNPVRKGQVDLFNRLNPDLYLMIDPSNNAQDKIIVQSIGGIGPDLFDSYGFASTETYVNAGIAWDITDPLREAGIVVQDLIWPVGIPSCVVKDRTYGFPCNVNADAIWFNMDLFDKAGIPYPKSGWTWEEFVDTATKLTVRDSRGKPVQFGYYMDWFGYPNLIKQHKARIWSEDGTQCTIGSDEGIAAFTKIHELMYKHRVMPSPQEEAALSTAGGWGTGGITFFMGGRVAMALGGRWWLNRLRDQPNMRLGVVEMPYAKVPVMQGGARCTLVNKNSPRREAALRFIKYLASREYNELVNEQADALPGVKKYSYTPIFEFNPRYPKETWNKTWRHVVEISQPEEVNPFVRGAELQPLNTQLDLIRANAKPVAAALRDAEREMNERILRQISLKPHLRELYRERTGKEFAK